MCTSHSSRHSQPRTRQLKALTATHTAELQRQRQELVIERSKAMAQGHEDKKAM
eukprot:g16126.t1